MAQLRSYIGVDTYTWSSVRNDMLESGRAIHPGEILFAKIEDDAIEQQVQLLRDRTQALTPKTVVYEPLSEEITYEDFIKSDLRTGVIVQAETVPKSKKLLRLQVDLGFETRQILSGIAEYVSVEEALGKSVVVVANLKPRKMLGLDSQGMILMASNPDGTLRFVESDGEPGSRIS